MECVVVRVYLCGLAGYIDGVLKRVDKGIAGYQDLELLKHHQRCGECGDSAIVV
jgi:hypothetical protein